MSEEGSLHAKDRDGAQQARLLLREQQVKEESAAERGNPTHKERWCLETH